MAETLEARSLVLDDVEEGAPSIQRAALTTTDRVLLVDDWIETGSQAIAARKLIEQCGAQWGGLAVLVDQAELNTRRLLEPVFAVVEFEALPPSVE